MSRFSACFGGILGTLGLIGYSGLCCSVWAAAAFAGFGGLFLFLSLYGLAFLLAGIALVAVSAALYCHGRKCRIR